MKIIIFTFLAYLFLTITSFSQTTKPNSTLQEAKNVIQDLNVELRSAKQTNIDLDQKLQTSKSNLENAELKIQEVQKTADILKDWGIEQQTQAFAWMDRFNKAIKRYHFLKNIAATIAAFYGLCLGLYCMKYVPPVYGAYAYALPLVGAFFGFFGVWLFL
jgi:hypothetical protein